MGRVERTPTSMDEPEAGATAFGNVRTHENRLQRQRRLDVGAQIAFVILAKLARVQAPAGIDDDGERQRVAVVAGRLGRETISAGRAGAVNKTMGEILRTCGLVRM